VDAVCTGAKLAMPGILRLESGIEVGAMVAVLTQKGEAVALMSALASGEQIMEAEHGLAARPVRVLMPRSSYPRMW
jgi:H/ACA ribonucleoprotein complex subunit 4